MRFSELEGDPFKRLITKKLYGLYDCVVCVSSKVASEMREVGIRCDRIIPIPIILERYAPSSRREPIILHVGASARKRSEVSVMAVKMLRDMGYDVKLVVVGHYRAGANESWVIVKERCSDSELRELYAKATALILPSEWEGFPYVVLEAQASGTPVVVGPGVPSEALVDGRSGFKVECFDPREYAEKIRLLLDNRSLWDYMSREARRYAENFDHVKIAEAYLSILEGGT